MYGQANATGRLGDVGASLEGVIDSFDAVILHADQETGGELGAHGASVEQRGRGMGEPPIRHQVVGLAHATKFNDETTPHCA